MEMIKVESSNINAIGYEAGMLFVRFNNGLVYAYSNVPQEVYDGLTAAESKGRYINESVKGKFNSCKLSA